MYRISAGSANYLIDVGGALAKHENATVIREWQAALGVLRPSVGDFYAMRTLRTLLAEVRHADVAHLNDVEVVEIVAGLVTAGLLSLVTPTRAGKVRFTMGAVPPAPAAAPATRASPSARSAPSEPVEPSFMADLDAALLAQSLKDASKDGVPFCEECARAAARAA